MKKREVFLFIRHPIGYYRFRREIKRIAHAYFYGVVYPKAVAEWKLQIFGDPSKPAKELTGLKSFTESIDVEPIEMPKWGRRGPL